MIRRTIWLIAVMAAAFLIGLIVLRGRGISARRTPWLLEARVARASWRFLIPSTARSAANPVPDTPQVLKMGREHWADHCATCHGNDGSGDTTVGRRVYPSVPDIRAAWSQQLTDGELFYAIEEGIPLTAMPAWGNGTPEGEAASWALVRFIRHLPALSPDELKDMERFTPRSPADLQRERDIDDFLNSPPKKPGGRGGDVR
jgi:mono/diheme cytochrome c family protein